MILNDRILKLVLVLADELHFGRTSARLHLSQPALSGIVKALERDLGVCLFKRTSRSVQLTGAGHVLVLEAQHLLEETERAVALIRASSSEILGPIRIGYLSSVNLQWMATLILRARRADFPAPQFQFIGLEATALEEQLARRTLQAAILTGRRAYPDCESAGLFREDLIVAISPGHKLARHSRVHLDELAREPVTWLRRDVDPLLYDSLFLQLREQGYQPNIVHEAQTYFECLQFVGSGLGITLVPRSMKSAIRAGSVDFIRIAPPVAQIEYTFAHSRSVHSVDLDRLVTFVQNQVPRRGLHPHR
jgi:DNA-binding transcriptional LysR family regulator